MISLDGVRMNVIETAATGVVNQDTVFHFSQTGNTVSSEYSGGKVVKGFLVGKRTGNGLSFSYCQLQVDGKLDNGISACEIIRHSNGKIRMIEKFEWKSRPGETGVNIFEEL